MINTLSHIKPFVPSNLKRTVKETLRKSNFRNALKGLDTLQSGAAPSRQLLVDLQAAWGNEGFAARTDYLQEVASRAATAKGAILECGSGLTTILLGSLAGRRGVETWSLEHMPEWHAQITETLRRHRVPKTNVCLAPLRHYGDFWWYDPPLNQMPATFNLIICDGPPGTTPGNRYGLLPVVGKRLGNDSLILLDDAQRPTEVAVLDRWAAEGQLKVDLREAPTGTFARVTLAAP